MRRIALTTALALVSLAFAPAPLAKRDRATALQKRNREVAECARRLGELGVTWEAAKGPDGPVVRFSADVLPNRIGSMSGERGFADGGLAAALRELIQDVEAPLTTKR